jgi:hypothetical protein
LLATFNAMPVRFDSSGKEWKLGQCYRCAYSLAPGMHPQASVMGCHHISSVGFAQQTYADYNAWGNIPDYQHEAT